LNKSVFSNSLNTLVTMTRRTCKKGWPLPHLEKFLLSTKFWTNFARCNFSSQLVLMKLTPGRAPRRARWRRILHCTLSTNLGWQCVFPWCWLYQRALLVPRSNPWSPSGSRLFWICPPKSRDPWSRCNSLVVSWFDLMGLDRVLSLADLVGVHCPCGVHGPDVFSEFEKIFWSLHDFEFARCLDFFHVG